MPYYYALSQRHLTDARYLGQIQGGLYKDYFEVCLLPTGLEFPNAIPVEVQYPINWLNLHRHDLLSGSIITIGFPECIRTYSVKTDWSIVEGHILIVEPLQ